LRNWGIEHGKPKADLFYCEAFLQIVQILKKNGHINEKQVVIENTYGRKKYLQS